MKIIVMDSANLRIEVLNVPDHMIDEDIEQFLAEHDYSLNNISWMAAPIDFVPVQFHEYGICHSDGEELHFVRQGKLKDFSIYGVGSVTAYFCFGVLGVILSYSLAEYQLTPTEWLYGVLELLALLFFCIILPQEATKSRDTKFIFPTAGYYERFIGK